MRKLLRIFGLLLFSFSIWAQGFVRPVILPQLLPGQYKSYSPQKLQYGADSSQIQIWLGVGGFTFEQAVTLYRPRDDQSLAFRNAFGNPTPVKAYQFRKNKILIRNGPGGGSSSYPTWTLWNLNGGLEGSVYPNRIASSFLHFKQDSIFILHSKPLVQENDSSSSFNFVAHDTNTVYYLTVLEPEKGQFHILDSIRLEPKFYDAGLHYLESEKQWELLKDDRRIRFSRGKFTIDSSFVDPSLSLGNFSDFGSSTNLEDLRRSFYDGGIDQFFYNEEKSKVYQLSISLNDSTYFDCSPIFKYFQKRGLAGNYYTQFDGNVSSLPATKESEKLIDWQFYSADTLFLFRLRSGIIEKRNYLQMATMPGFIFRDCLSDTKGGFYLLGSQERSAPYYSQPVLVYLDKNGRTKTLVGNEPFNVHYNADENRIKLFLENPNIELDYRIVDASGRPLQEGSIKAHEGISIGYWAAAIYYLQLWEKNGNYYGQQPFLKARY